MKAAISSGLVLILGCAFGGSDADPRREIPVDSGVEELDAASPDGEAPTEAGPSDDRDASKDPETCAPTATIAVCDPVRNTGCALTQCDVDTESAVLAGRCVFFQPPLGTTCSANELSETCDPMHTCVSGSCRKLCWCARDCAAGECCEAAPDLGLSTGFKLCGPC